MKSPVRFFIVTTALALAATARAGEMTPLFDGKTLDGWEVKSGTATYKVEDGTIVGTTTEGSPNTFLCTKKTYGDFVLEFEVKDDPALNSGVQFRSEAYDKDTEIQVEGKPRKFPAGRVFGYQVEIASNGNAGRVYDEARRGRWVETGKSPSQESKEDAEKATEAGRKSYKIDGWNSYRVIAQGDHIQTFINGTKITDFHDATTAKGFFGLQVHQIKKGEGPYSVCWRNIKIRELQPGEKP
jgi:hypothetical protein